MATARWSWTAALVRRSHNKRATWSEFIFHVVAWAGTSQDGNTPSAKITEDTSAPHVAAGRNPDNITILLIWEKWKNKSLVSQSESLKRHLCKTNTVVKTVRDVQRKNLQSIASRKKRGCKGQGGLVQ